MSTLYTVDGTSLEELADTIRTVGGVNEELLFPSGFMTAIESISNWELIGSTQITVNTSSTSVATAGTIMCGTGAYTKDALIYVRVRDHLGKRDGYFYGTDAIFLNSNKANGSTSTFGVPTVAVIRVSAAGAYTTYSGSYGVYGYSISSAGTVTLRSRYHSTYSLIIDSKYDVEVYKLSLPPSMVLFE